MLIELAKAVGDPFRVQSGSVHVAADLDPAVLFTTKYRGAIAEQFSIPVSVIAAERTGTITYGRSYPRIPLVFAALVRGTAIDYPYLYVFTSTTNGGANWAAVNDYLKIEAAAGSLRYRTCAQQVGAGSGTLKIWVVG